MAESSSSKTEDEQEYIEHIKPLIIINETTQNGELHDAMKLVKEGQDAFNRGYCAAASGIFKSALKILTKFFGHIHFECGKVYYLFGLSELYRIPLSNDDVKLARIAVEADDYLSSDDIITNSYTFKRGLQGGDFSEAWKVLCSALNCSNKDQNNLLNTQVLAALGETSYRRGDDHAYVYYKEASRSIGGGLTATDIRRILLKFKTGQCLQKVSNIEAMKYYEECKSLCKSRENYLKAREKQGLESEFSKKLDLTVKLNELIEDQIAGLKDANTFEKRKTDLLNQHNKNPVSKKSPQIGDPREFLKKKAKANADRQMQIVQTPTESHPDRKKQTGEAEATTESHPERQNQTVQDTNQIIVQKKSPNPQCCPIQ